MIYHPTVASVVEAPRVVLCNREAVSLAYLALARFQSSMTCSIADESGVTRRATDYPDRESQTVC
jgi:hypothetical protein